MFRIYTLKTFCLTLTLLLTASIGAQDLPHVPSELLVQPKTNITDMIHELENRSEGQIDFSLMELTSAPMNIYRLSFASTLTDAQVLRFVRSQKIGVAQFNHYVQDRATIPNDPQFDSQWQYVNTGQSGGTPDADIDIDDAWDITTGGLTALGDTIVVCVIDDGIDADHPDIEPNLWVNYQEVPNNGIDDDGNGFVDDVRGWDTSNDNDAVYDGGGHGTPVAGIVGAKGNNGTGVAGVNWDVKLMIVQGGTGQENEVLEAYSYPLTMRQLYNEFGGTRGAYVVSTNASWGIDFGQPDDAPLWCAFYDTLGTYGIISCGATINGNQNVDVIGDLPTACPSEYLISVTNMNHFDEKVTGAGYGATTIDLGAFGQNAYTVASGGGYDGFGGTSGATPHVAGTIGLLYSAPCSNLISLAQQDPAAAAEMVRDAVLDGVDPNASLSGITTTEGRLNVFNSMNLILGSCGPCPGPTSLSSANIIDVSADLSWLENDSIEEIDLEWRPVGAANWTLVDNVTSPYPLTGLMACTQYEYRLLGYCSEDTSDVSGVHVFVTDGCCENPESLEIVSLDSTSMLIEWEAVFAANMYDLQLTNLSTGDSEFFNTTTTSFDFSDLDACTDYEVSIQLVCDSGGIGYTEPIAFTTFGCGACIDFSYCDTEDFDNSEEWIESVQVGFLVNENSGAGTDSYVDLTGGSISAEFALDIEYSISLEPGYAGQEFEEYFTVYIDYNHDGDFLDAGEEIFNSGAAMSGEQTGQFTVPSSASLGLTRMRVYMQYDSEGGPCEGSQDWGEVEDYCITIVSASSLVEISLLDWNLSPNPTDGMINLDLSRAHLSGVALFEVLDPLSRLLYSEKLSTGSKSLIDLSALKSGVYFIRMSDGEGVKGVRRLVIEK